MATLDLSRWSSVINPWTTPFYELEERKKYRYFVLKGGAGSGKSYGVYQAIVFQLITEDSRRILVARKVAKTLRESCFATIKQVISTLGLNDIFDINKTDMTITCKHNGSMILFTGLDDPEKIKSIVVDSIVLEEATEFEKQDFEQLDIRCRGITKYPKNIFILFNPISAGHWLKRYFWDMPKPDAKVMETTYNDNIFLDEKAKQVLLNMRDTNFHYYKIYCLNEWGTTGESYFDSNILNDRLDYLRKNPHENIMGYFKYKYENERIVDSSIQFITDFNGAITIFSKPIKDFPYVLGGDTAGDSYGDFFSCHIIDNTTGNLVATLHQNTDESEFARQVYCLGKYYNYCLIGLESNYSTYPIKELQRLGYLNQYQRRIEDKVYVDLKESFGFLTNKLTRPIILANLQDLVKETKASFLCDMKTIDEMLTFIRNEKKNGRPEGDIGTHDDRVMSLAICMYIREQQRMKPKKPKGTQRKPKRKSILGY